MKYRIDRLDQPYGPNPTWKAVGRTASRKDATDAARILSRSQRLNTRVVVVATRLIDADLVLTEFDAVIGEVPT